MAIAQSNGKAQLIEDALATLSIAEATSIMEANGTAEMRLAFACALIAQIHDASLLMLTQLYWHLHGQRIYYLSMPGAHGERVRMPGASFSEQIDSHVYVPHIANIT
jgi:hypothetical protein